jgi:hypothetical protein
MSEQSRVLCIHMEVELDENGFVSNGKTFTSWQGTIQHSHDLRHVADVRTGTADDSVVEGFADLFDYSLKDLEGRPR